MPDIVRVGVIGCGAIAQIMHLPYLQELPQFEIGAVCDLSPSVVETVGNKYGVARRYTDYRALLDQRDLDAVLVANLEHYPVALAALEAGKHVFVEKPMTFNLAEADALVAAAEERRLVLMCGYMKCYDPGYEWALPLLQSMADLRLIRIHDFSGNSIVNREIYDLVQARDVPADIVRASQERIQASMIQAIGAERAHLVDAYSQLLGLASHDAAILRRAFGDPERISFADVFAGRFTVATLDYGANTRCHWECGTIAERKGWDEQLVAYGSERIVEVQFPFPYLRNEATMVNIVEMEGESRVEKRVLASYDEAFKREWRHFYTCVTEGKMPITSGRQARGDLALLIGMIQAVQL